MKTITPTKLRSNLFLNIENALKGIPVLIKTRKGNALLMSEGQADKLFSKKKAKKQKTGVLIKINGTLDDADELLGKYIKLPSG